MSIPLHLIRRAAADIVTALPSTAYAQGTGVTAAWTKSLSPFGSLDEQGDASTHLEFAVFVGPVRGDGQSRYSPGDEGEFRGVLAVVFRWDIDPGDQDGSYDLSMQAAHDVMVALNRDGAWPGVGGEVQLTPLDRFTPSLLPGVLAMQITVSFNFTYSEGV